MHMTTTADGLLEAILSRRSVAMLGEPAPTADQLDGILAAATTVPDHGSLKPRRFVVVRGAGRDAFGDALADAALHHDATLPAERRSKLRSKAFLAPVLVVVISSPQPNGKVPEWEQVASASCSGYALVLTAHALGLGAVWKSADYLAGPDLTRLLQLQPAERLLGWVAIGTPTKPDPRPPTVATADDSTSILDGWVLRQYRS
jgi:nitroreductase